MIFTSAEILSTALADLPSDQRRIIQSHFMDGNSIFKIQQSQKLKRIQIEQILRAGLECMRNLLLARGVRNISDVM